MLPVKIDDTSLGISHSKSKEMKGENDCTGNMGNTQISLTQYYSHFIDGSNDVISPCVNYETKSISTSKDFTSKNMIKGNNNGSPVQIKPKIWKCLYNCGKIFTREKYMKNHILVMHENTSLVQCEVCFKFLSTKARLKSHMLRHSGVQHLVCLICVNERANDLSCIRHHLLEKHGISSKHSLFHESYYEMSLKEMSLMKMSKSRGFRFKDCKTRKTPVVEDRRKSANHLDELKWKVMERSERVKNMLSMMEATKDDGLKVIKELSEEKRSFVVRPKEKVVKTRLQKIVTAENGMKLVKLSNGQFKKVT